MRITDIIYLGWANLRSHFGRSLLTMGVIGTLFCLIFIAQFGFQGFENQYFTYACLLYQSPRPGPEAHGRMPGWG